MPSCPDFTFEYARAAAQYSVLAGVLAGVAFFSMVLLLGLDTNRDPADGPKLDDAIFVLTCAFLGLVISTFLYGVLSGEEPTTGTDVNTRTLSLALISGTAFSLAILNLLLGLVLVVRSRERYSAAADTALLFAVLAPPLIGVYLGLAIDDLRAVVACNEPAFHWGVVGFLFPLGAYALVRVLRRFRQDILETLRTWPRQTRWSRLRRWLEDDSWYLRVAGYTFILPVVGLAIRDGFLASGDVDTRLTEVAQLLTAGAAVPGLFLFLLVMDEIRTSARRRSQSESSTKPAQTNE